MKQKSFRILLAEGESGEAAAALHELFPGEQNGLQFWCTGQHQPCP